MKKILPKCEAVYGDKKCQNEADRAVVVDGIIRVVCNKCAKIIIKQNKVNGK